MVCFRSHSLTRDFIRFPRLRTAVPTTQAGSYTDKLAAVGASTCTACSPGSYSKVSTEACAVCTAGSTTNELEDAAATSCTACAAGTFSAASTVACDDCVAGHATNKLDKEAATTCTACIPGQFSAKSTTACANCAPGSVTDSLADAAATTCTACVAGEYSAVSTIDCDACSPGSVTDTLASVKATTCTKCAAGSFSATATVACASCAAGSTAAASGTVKCLLCSPGSYTKAEPRVACEGCPAGSETDRAVDVSGALKSLFTKDNQYGFGASTCTQCSLGKYTVSSQIKCMGIVDLLAPALGGNWLSNIGGLIAPILSDMQTAANKLVPEIISDIIVPDAKCAARGCGSCKVCGKAFGSTLSMSKACGDACISADDVCRIDLASSRVDVKPGCAFDVGELLDF